MDISVVLCTYNNCERLRVTLNSLCQLNVRSGVDWELVTVNNNSTDDTERVIKSLSDRLPITYVHESKQGLSRALNAGVDAARGELIVFTDDDVKPGPDWLTAYWEAYQKRPEEWYFGGPIESEYEGEPPDEDLSRVAPHSVSGFDYGPEACELPSQGYFVGANWACPSEHLQQVGPFDERLGLNAEGGVGEETDLMSRLEAQGIQGWYVPRAKIQHYVPASKATLEHVLSRKTAPVTNAYAGDSSLPKTVFGLPLGLYKEAALHGIDWVLRWATGQMWKAEYGSWRVWVERIKAYHRRGS